jgi:hypothetical protein
MRLTPGRVEAASEIVNKVVSAMTVQQMTIALQYVLKSRQLDLVPYKRIPSIA